MKNNNSINSAESSHEETRGASNELTSSTGSDFPSVRDISAEEAQARKEHFVPKIVAALENLRTAIHKSRESV